MRSIALLVLFIVVPLTRAAAENLRGNGGDAVVCYNDAGAIVSAELLDFFEARTATRSTLALGPDVLTASARVAYVLQRLERLDPMRATSYRLTAAEFFDSVQMRHDIILQDIPDSGGSIIPRRCKVEQLAVYMPYLFPDEVPRSYVVNADLWEHLSAVDQAGLVLHEIIYREMSSDGQTESRRARFFNRRISSENFATLDAQGYAELLKQAHLPSLDCHRDSGACATSAVAINTGVWDVPLRVRGQ